MRTKTGVEEVKSRYKSDLGILSVLLLLSLFVVSGRSAVLVCPLDKCISPLTTVAANVAPVVLHPKVKLFRPLKRELQRLKRKGKTPAPVPMKTPDISIPHVAECPGEYVAVYVYRQDGIWRFDHCENLAANADVRW